MNKKRTLKKTNNNFLGGNRESEMFNKGIGIFCCIICIIIVVGFVKGLYDKYYGPNSDPRISIKPFPYDTDEGGINWLFKKKTSK